MKNCFLTKIMCIMTIIAIFMSINIGVVQASTSEAYEINDIFKDNYWEWHTRTTTDDKAYNGKHIKIEENKITFYGYGQNSYKDFLYKEFPYAGKKIFKIRVDETKASYHTLEGAGFLINSTIKNNKISGYILLYTEKQICIYRVNNVDVKTLEETSNATISKQYGTLIKTVNKTSSTIHDVVIESTPTYIKVNENGNTMEVKLDYAEHVGESFGLISSYVQHDCSILSTIVFERISVQLENYVVPITTLNTQNQLLAGASYEIKDEKGNVVRKGTSNSNGIFEAIGLSEGTYTAYQTKAPAGYKSNSGIAKFKVTSDGKVININTNKETQIKFVNEPITSESKNSSSNKNNTKTKTSTVTKNVNNVNKDKTTSKTKLPQTGENSAIIVGALMTSLGILIIAFMKYKF